MTLNYHTILYKYLKIMPILRSLFTTLIPWATETTVPWGTDSRLPRCKRGMVLTHPACTCTNREGEGWSKGSQIEKNHRQPWCDQGTCPLRLGGFTGSGLKFKFFICMSQFLCVVCDSGCPLSSCQHFSIVKFPKKNNSFCEVAP